VRRVPSSAVPRALMTTMVVGTLLLAACGGGGEVSIPQVSPTPTPEVTATPEPTPTPGPIRNWPQITTATITTDNLNVRTGPGANHTVVGQLQPGAEVPVSGRGPGSRWLALTGIGWVAHSEDWMTLPVGLSTLPEITIAEAGYDFVGPVHPAGTNIGIPVVDEVVTAVVHGDTATVLRVATAPDDDPDTGTTRVPPSTACPVYPASEMEQHIEAFITSEAAPGGRLHLFAVVGTPGVASTDTTAGVDPTFIAIFAFADEDNLTGEGRQVWISAAGDGIVWFSMGCEPTTPGDMLRVTPGEPFFWFRPALPDPLTPVE